MDTRPVGVMLARLSPQVFKKFSGYIYILCTISLAIVLYSWVHQHQISSFICCHEDTCSAEHLTRISILKNMELRNAAAVLK